MREILSRPLTLGGITLKNRMLSAPTSLAELGPEEHYSPANVAYYKLRAMGGCSLVTVGDVIVDLDTGRSHPQQVGINDPSALPYLVEMAEAIHSGGAMASIELDHGGALCAPEFIGGKNAFGPSGYVDDWGDMVEEMTEEEIYRIADAFAKGAVVAKDCGFDMVMIHAGHGWLLHQFISPITNHRKDKWGGSLENRMRFTMLVVDRVRKAVGRSFPIDIRISGSERMPGGYTIETGMEIAKMLDGKVDLIHVSAGTQQDLYSFILMHPGVFQAHGENGTLAAAIKKKVKTPVCAVGAFTDPDKTEKFLQKTGVDCVALGRTLIADPDFPKKVLEERTQDITPCIRCGECQSGMMAKRVIRCSVNPIIGREQEAFIPIPVNIKKKILIVGAGPGGMQAALEAVKRGHQVVICDEKDKLGGALEYADTADFKAWMKIYRDSQISKVEKAGVEIRLRTRVDKTVIDEIQPDVLIAAVGAKPISLPVHGADGENVVFGADLKPDTKLGEQVAVIGGGLIGCEEAIWLAQNSHKVTILEMQHELAPDCGKMHRINLLQQIEDNQAISVKTGHRCTRITLEGVYAIAPDGSEAFFPAEHVVMAAGMRCDCDGVEALRPLVNEFHIIGDANKAGRLMAAVRDAYDAVVRLGL